MRSSFASTLHWGHFLTSRKWFRRHKLSNVWLHVVNMTGAVKNSWQIWQRTLASSDRNSPDAKSDGSSSSSIRLSSVDAPPVDPPALPLAPVDMARGQQRFAAGPKLRVQ